MEKNGELFSGSIGKRVIGFATPIILTNLIQAIYGIVDMITVGHFVGSSGMSAVSMGAQITAVVLVIVNGLSNGGTVISAQLTGQGKQKEVSCVTGTMLSFFTILALIMMALIMAFSRPLLRLFNTPPVAFEQAVQYLLICMAGTVFVYAYNSMAAMLRGVGDSRAPMFVVIITVVLNAVLDVLMIGPLHMGVAGAAWATIISQFVSMVLIALYIKYRRGLFDFRPCSFRIHREFLSLIVRIGLPQAIQFVFASSSFLLMSGIVNIYGVEASAAAGAAAKVQTLANLPAQGMMVALLSFTAQNLAVGEPKRALKGMWIGMAFSTAICMLIFAFCMIWPELTFRCFTPEIAVESVGIGYLRCMAFSFVLESIMFCMFGVVSGSGYTLVTMACGILSGFVVRFGTAWLLSSVAGLGFNGVGLAYMAGPIASSLICLVFMLTGKWKKARVQIGP